MHVVKYKVEFYTVGTQKLRERFSPRLKLTRLRKTSWRDFKSLDLNWPHLFGKEKDGELKKV